MFEGRRSSAATVCIDQWWYGFRDIHFKTLQGNEGMGWN